LLQEAPVWALGTLGGWSEMAVLGDIARRPRLPRIARALTARNLGLFRSLFTGQAMAILLAKNIEILERSVVELNRRGLLGVGKGERRICQIARLRTAGQTLLLGNLHTTNIPLMAGAQSERAAARLTELAKPGEPIVLGGDFNVTPQLEGWELAGAGTDIDHILVRGAQASPLRVWPDERRTKDGKLLSDHPPVEIDLTL
jgi:endonuclease/exonuclease/phosphatase family metal-dependent hydrolase